MSDRYFFQIYYDNVCVFYLDMVLDLVHLPSIFSFHFASIPTISIIHTFPVHFGFLMEKYHEP